MNNQATLPFSGKSMHPFINNDESITVQFSDYDISEGSIYLYKDPYSEELISHRLIYMNEKELELKGDFSLGSEVIKEDYLLGKVISINQKDINSLICNKPLATLSKNMGRGKWGRRLYLLILKALNVFWRVTSSSPKESHTSNSL